MKKNMKRYAKREGELMPRDHRFTAAEKAEYDSLTWRGRDFYDDARWNEGTSHDVAFRDARYAYGLKRV